MPEQIPRPVLNTTRFDFVRKIGEGGMGVVYEVIDREREERLALKTLRAMNANALLRFKTEYRLLQDLQHPNLVQLGELFVEDGMSYFTMELVRGVPFLRYVRADELDSGTDAPAFIEDRLRSTLLQLAEGLSYLHSGKRIHRDIKPSNLLVTDEGRVVILDFGLVTYADERQTRSRFLVGTEFYMAPEQAATRPVGPEADWYGVGVVLYQALTGVLPFVGRPKRVLELKQTSRPVAPRELLPEVPPDLDQLCMDLLATDPDRRPRGRDVLRRLGKDAPELGWPAEDVLVGRTEELGILRNAFLKSRFGGAVAVVVQGESGIGKSALLKKFSEDVRAEYPNAVLLAGKCSERESVPFQAIDGVIDDLTRHLASRHPTEVAELLPPDAGKLAQAFPVLQRIGALAGGGPAWQDAQERRAGAAGAIREILRRLSQRQPVVMTVENLQWADHEGLRLLREILLPPDEPRLLFVGTARSDATGDFELHLDNLVPLRLAGLAPADAVQLASELLARTPGASPAAAGRIAEEARGHPLFIDDLVKSERALGSSGTTTGELLDAAVRARVDGLDRAAREILELVAIADAPVSPETVAQASGLELSDLHGLLVRLEQANLLRAGGRAVWEAIEPYHVRVRETVLSRLGPAERRTCHARLAKALEQAPRTDVEAIAGHWREAGNADRAAEYALVAAEKATRSHAFARAASFYAMALSLGAQRPDLAAVRLKLAEALVDAGRAAEAGQAFLDAAVDRSPDEALELKCRGADQLLKAGCFDQGIRGMNEVLRAVGVQPPGRSAAVRFSLVRGRLAVRLRGLGYQARKPTKIPRRDLLRIDACYSAANGLGMVDLTRAADFQTRHLRLALDAGEPSRVALALGLEASFSALAGTRSSPRTTRMLAEVERIGDRLADPFVSARLLMNAAVAALLEGRWRAALEQCERAETILKEKCTGVAWERSTVQQLLLHALAQLGEVGQLARRVAGGQLSTRHLALVDLAGDDPEGARRRCIEAWSGGSRKDWRLEHFGDLSAQCEIDLYAGDARGAWERVTSHWRDAIGSGLMRIQLIRIQMHDLRMRAALALARSERNARTLAQAAGDARRVIAEGAGWALPLAHLGQAAIADLRGDTEGALALLQQAEHGFDQASMQLHGAVTRWRRGHLLAGGRGPELLCAAEAVLLEQGIRKEQRFAAVLAPGFAGRR
jgi:hypothetical protein